VELFQEDEFCDLNSLNVVVEMDLLGKMCMYKIQTLRKLTVYSLLSEFVIVGLPFFIRKPPSYSRTSNIYNPKSSYQLLYEFL
jgi:hypothetical protein